MISEERAQQFAEEWVAAWNAHDLEKILSHYDDNFTMSSPVIAKLMGVSSGTLVGKAEVGDYWARALTQNPQLKFTLQNVYLGSSSVAIEYDGVRGRVIEVFEFGSGGTVVSAAAHYVL